MLLRIITLSICTLAIISCGNRHIDSRLTRIERLCTKSPEEALDSLNVIDYTHLSEAEKHYYDFLSVKVADKAYIIHRSDSLILSVIDYESKHLSNGRYPESLYYGGRVYCDLGDSPTALHYFQTALDLISGDNDHLTLRSNILSQTGRLLTSQSLYSEAIPYISESLDINILQHDTINTIHGFHLLGGTHLRNGDYTKAETCMREALRLSAGQTPHHAAKSKMYLAAIKYQNHDLDSALYYIRGLSDRVKPIVRNSVMGYAANIYLKSGILDTAYMYAKELIDNSDPTHAEIGYQVLLSPELRGLSNLDSIHKYISEYRTLLETYYDSNQIELAIRQQNLYNYQLHERKKALAEQQANAWKRWVVCLTL